MRSIVLPLFASLAAAAIVYAATNPFVLINAIAHPEVLRSNLGNSTAMYSASRDGAHALRSAARIAAAALTPGWLIVGLAAAIGVIGESAYRRRRLSAITWLSIVLAAVITFQFVVLAAGKPAEYARFGLAIVALGCVLASHALGRLASALRQGQFLCAVLVVTCVGALVLFEAGWAGKPTGSRTRRQIEQQLARRPADGLPAPTVAVLFEPAPWSSPAIDLFETVIALTPRGEPPMAADVMVVPVNLSTQFRWLNGRRESVDWRNNWFLVGGR